VHVTFVVENVVFEQAFIQIGIIPPMLHTHIHLHVNLTGRQTGEIWEPDKNRGVLEIVQHSVGK